MSLQKVKDAMRGVKKWFEERYRWVVVFASCQLFAMCLGIMFLYGLLFVDIQQSLNATATETGMVGSVAWGMNQLACPLAAILQVFFGARMVAVSGTTMCALFIFLASYSTNIPMLISFYGIGYGAGTAFVFQALVSVIYKYFDSSGMRTRTTAIALAGGTLAQTAFSKFIEVIITRYGWGMAMRVFSALVSALALPFAFLIIPPDEDAPKPIPHTETHFHQKRYEPLPVQEDTSSYNSSSVDDIEEAYEKQNELLYHEEDNNLRDQGIIITYYDERYNQVTTSVDSKDNSFVKNFSVEDKCVEKNYFADPHYRRNKDQAVLVRWLRLSRNLNAWLYVVAVTCFTMAWSGYTTNIVSFFNSIGIDEDSSAIFMTIWAFTELVCKLVLGMFADRIPIQPLTLLIIQAFTMIFTSLIVGYISCVWHTFVLAGMFGVMRGFVFVLPYPVGLDVVKNEGTDEMVAVSAFACGVGYTTGTLPLGLVYDATDSYHYGFYLLAVQYFLALILLGVIRFRLRKPKRKLQPTSRDPKPIQGFEPQTSEIQNEIERAQSLKGYETTV